MIICNVLKKSIEQRPHNDIYAETECKYHFEIKSFDQMFEKVLIFGNYHNYANQIEISLNQRKLELIGI